MAEILPASVYHARTRPKKNAFRYGVYYFALSLDEFERPTKRALFSLDRFNLFSVYGRDYGDGKQAPKDWIGGVLKRWNLSEADGEIVLVTLPRILGYAFNPVSFWLCYDKEAGLRAVLAEVSNTFGERHSYLCFHEDHRPIRPTETLRAEKVFHVSPFIEVAGHYEFRFSINKKRLAVSIDLKNQGGLLLSTGIAGERRPLTSGRALYYFIRYPLVTLKVVALIHYQAAKLFMKGVRHISKPPPPAVEISR